VSATIVSIDPVYSTHRCVQPVGPAQHLGWVRQALDGLLGAIGTPDNA